MKIEVELLGTVREVEPSQLKLLVEKKYVNENSKIVINGVERRLSEIAGALATGNFESLGGGNASPGLNVPPVLPGNAAVSPLDLDSLSDPGAEGGSSAPSLEETRAHNLALFKGALPIFFVLGVAIFTIVKLAGLPFGEEPEVAKEQTSSVETDLASMFPPAVPEPAPAVTPTPAPEPAPVPAAEKAAPSEEKEDAEEPVESEPIEEEEEETPTFGGMGGMGPTGVAPSSKDEPQAEEESAETEKNEIPKEARRVLAAARFKDVKPGADETVLKIRSAKGLETALERLASTGGVIELAPQKNVYQIWKTHKIGKNITIRSASKNPGDVTIGFGIVEIDYSYQMGGFVVEDATLTLEGVALKEFYDENEGEPDGGYQDDKFSILNVKSGKVSLKNCILSGNDVDNSTGIVADRQSVIKVRDSRIEHFNRGIHLNGRSVLLADPGVVFEKNNIGAHLEEDSAAAFERTEFSKNETACKGDHSVLGYARGCDFPGATETYSILSITTGGFKVLE